MTPPSADTATDASERRAAEETNVARVVATHGRHCVVETPAGERVRCHPRGKRLEVVVGDQVIWCISHDEGVIEHILPRRNLLFRQDATRTKRFAANIDQVVMVLAAEPAWPERLLARALIACEAAQIPALIVLNKADLTDAFRLGWQRLQPYRDLHYDTLALVALPHAENTNSSDQWLHDLQKRLYHRTNLILGPSGVGKSTLINRLVPTAQATTGEVSQALGSGRHTTTSTTWYWLDGDRQTALIDSPGFQEFGLAHIPASDLAACMPDVVRWANECRFYNCRHLKEPGCAVRAHVGDDASGEMIHPERYRVYVDLCAELGGLARKKGTSE